MTYYIMFSLDKYVIAVWQDILGIFTKCSTIETEFRFIVCTVKR